MHNIEWPLESEEGSGSQLSFRVILLMCRFNRDDGRSSGAIRICPFVRTNYIRQTVKKGDALFTKNLTKTLQVPPVSETDCLSFFESPTVNEKVSFWDKTLST